MFSTITRMSAVFVIMRSTSIMLNQLIFIKPVTSNILNNAS